MYFFVLQFKMLSVRYWYTYTENAACLFTFSFFKNNSINKEAAF